MNSAHASLLQWLQENPGNSVVVRSPSKQQPHWFIWRINRNYAEGKGPSYEAACYDLLQQLKR